MITDTPLKAKKWNVHSLISATRRPPPSRRLVVGGNPLPTRGETAALLAVLGVGQGPGANTELCGARVHQGAAAGGAVGVAGALARDELPALAVAHVGGARRVGLEGAGLDGGAGAAAVVVVVVVVSGVVIAAVVVPAVIIVAAVVVIVSTVVVIVPAVVVVLVPALVAGTAGLEAAALLASLGLGTHAGADANGLAASGERRAASGGAVGSSETLAADELSPSAVSDVLLTGRVRNVLADGKIRGGLDGREGHWQLALETDFV